MSGFSLFNFLVVKPLTWTAGRLFGDHAKQSTEDELAALEAPIRNELARVIGAEAAAIVTSRDMPLAQLETAIAPKAASIVTDVIAKAGVPEQYVPQVTAFATALLPELVGAAYADASANASASVTPAS